MKRIIQFLSLSSAFLTLTVEAQNIGINSTGALPAPSAILDVSAAPSNDKGLLVPRIPLLATNSASPVTSPATSLLVYNTASASSGTTAVSPGFYYWDASKWIRLQVTNSTTQDWNLSGNTGTTPGTDFFGTTDNKDLVIKTNNSEKMRIAANGKVGIGTNLPNTLLEINNGSTNGAIKIVDGTQGVNKVLTSDANGVGTWVTNVSITPTQLGNIPPVLVNLSSSDIYTGATIALPAGKWLVYMGIQVNGSTAAGQSAWIRYTLSSSSTVNTPAGFSFIQSSVVSTNVNSAGYVFFPCTGVIPVNVPVATTLYVWTSSCQQTGGFNLASLNVGPNPENYLFAVPIN